MTRALSATLARGAAVSLLLLALSGCMTSADVVCHYTPDGWACSGGVGGNPPTPSSR